VNIFSAFLKIAAGLMLIVIPPFKQTSDWQGKVEIKDGTPWIQNPREPIYGGTVLALEAPLRIGEYIGKDEFMFQDIGCIEADDQERVYVSDWKESRIKIFDKNGVYLKTIGQRGQGPGEFERINRLQIIDDKRLVVFDGNLKRLSIFSLGGDFEKSIPVQKMSPLDLCLISDGMFLVQTVQLDPVLAKADSAIKLYDRDLKMMKILATHKPQDVFTPFQSHLVWAVFQNGDIVIGRNEKYSFSLYDSRGDVMKTITKDSRPIPIPDEEKKIELKRLQQPYSKDVPAFYPAYRSMTIDGNRRIMVQTWERPNKGDGFLYDVFDSEGKFMARMVLKNSPRLWKRNRMYAIEENEDGLPVVVRYTVAWKN